MKVEFIGHAAFVLSDETSGARVYIDPAISVVGGDAAAHHPTAVLVTHGHGDHVGDTLALLRANPEAKCYAMVELAGLLARDLGDAARCVGCNKGGEVDLGRGWRAALVDAKHSSSYGDAGAYAGEACGWVVRAPDGTAVYHTGDTDVFAGMADIVAVHRPAAALVCIGGHYTMGPRGAALAVARHLAPTVRIVVPMHYGTWPILAGTPAQLQAELAALGCSSVEVRAMKPGSSSILP